MILINTIRTICITDAYNQLFRSFSIRSIDDLAVEEAHTSGYQRFF
jgi:hypothetical protein